MANHLTWQVRCDDNDTDMTRHRVNTIAPATLVALAMVMAVGSAPPELQQVSSRQTAGDRQQVAQLLAAVKQAAKVLNGKSVCPAAALARFASTDAVMPLSAFAHWHMDDRARLVLLSSFTPHMIDLPPPALNCI